MLVISVAASETKFGREQAYILPHVSPCPACLGDISVSIKI